MLVPNPPGAGPVGKYLAKRGGGIHHLALGVDDVDAVLAHLRAHGVRLIDETPRRGAHATRIVFVHPESTGGLLIEFVQEQK
jgi:methylmalonyl-CoA/ethylmalonyl-CoA epimerase